MADEEDTLVRRRSRRSTAGNRMEAALAEMIVEEVPHEAEEDKDFIMAKDEDDVFESDFESTDEEAAQDFSEAGEKAVLDEDKRERKTVRSRVERAVASANARQRVTFNPQPQAASDVLSQAKTPKPKRRVSLGVAIDVETGEVMDSGAQRRSSRTHTMLNRTVTANRIKNAEERRASIIKKTKVKIRPPTQDELIARALDMEEGNTREHRDYLLHEEEKRKRARVVRASIQGPLLRWISRKEEIKVSVPQPPPPPQPARPTAYWYAQAAQPGATPTTTPYGQYVQGEGGSWAVWPTSQSQTQAGPSTQQQPSLYQGSSTPLAPTYTSAYYLPPQPLPLSVEQIETVTKNYVVQETDQVEDTPKPTWRETMQAMFGDHVDWEEVKVFVGKGRPLSRPVMKCPITGLPAPYLDPRTGVPYADVRAYQVLTGILNHEYVWNSTLGCYVGRVSGSEKADGAIQR
ncbi:YL1-domain-containing protein [Neolentinus lepideus HHB14362 ss-1]|uniref:YL1-domain-containing protein n=1 Tax=Neolentinus lepideus HHB14362 ss-1 TaxID=1314782 RepID=A0A165S608_9AGAM|nr:YL1-domain-containing protein [Neolentinus lepideus HHB14362 ss-1]